MSDIVPAWNQALVDEIDANRQRHRSEGVDAVGECFRLGKHYMWSTGHIVLRHYPELNKERRGRGGAVFSFESAHVATGYAVSTIARWINTAKAGGETDETFAAWVAPLVERAKEKWLSGGRAQLTPPLPDDKYQVIYADPPWDYENDTHSQEASQETVLKDHYLSMTIAELCALPIGDLASIDCVLFMWVTSPLLEEPYEVIKAWGFQYKTSMVWDKVKHNVGNYVSVRHELLLICARGTIPKVPRLVDSVYEEERTEHSVKPTYFRDLIDELYPDGKRIELFARGELPAHWDSWGNETDDN